MGTSRTSRIETLKGYIQEHETAVAQWQVHLHEDLIAFEHYKRLKVYADHYRAKKIENLLRNIFDGENCIKMFNESIQMFTEELHFQQRQMEQYVSEGLDYKLLN